MRSIAFGWLLFGLFGQLATRVGVLVPQANSGQPPISLATVYPMLPTWWIPESAWGFAAVLLLIAIGFTLEFTGNKLQKMLDHL